MTESSAFETLATELLNDPDRDVSRAGDSLQVRGRTFAHVEGDLLVVRLQPARADDLIARGQAVAASAPSTADGADATASWVSIADREDWSELAAEAHVLAEGHVPGGQS